MDIIGRPYDNQHFQHLVQLAKGKKVRFLTTASDADVVEAYRRAMCVVLPSVYETDEYKTNTPELLGQTLLEGMACGAAGIATNVASLPEVVEDGVSGILVEPNNAEALRLAIVELVENQERHRQMCLAAGTGPC